MKNPGSSLKLSLTHTLPPTPPFITPLAYSYLCMYYKAEQILVTCSVSSLRSVTRKQEIFTVQA